MKHDEITSRVGLEKKHYVSVTQEVPLIDSHTYTPLGRELFSLYQKYKIEAEDQRRFESLSYLLITFTNSRNTPPQKSLWKSILGRLTGKR